MNSNGEPPEKRLVDINPHRFMMSTSSGPQLKLIKIHTISYPCEKTGVHGLEVPGACLTITRKLSWDTALASDPHGAGCPLSPWPPC